MASVAIAGDAHLAAVAPQLHHRARPRRATTMIKAVKFVSIPVRNQDKALQFYTEALGFRVVTDQPMGPGAQRWIELRIPGADTGVVLFTPDGHEDRIGTFQGISFRVDDVAKTHEEMTRRGVEFSQGPTKQDWGTFAIFKDVDGNQFVLGTK
jgi:catechol 2,3-dioxygenase-like lactoylglutathione lyase family enzyme